MYKQYVTLIQHNSQFRYLWFAQVVSLFGDWFGTIATIILVNRYTHSGVAVGTLFVLRALPPFVLGPVAGVIADRFDRKKVLIASDLLRFVIVLGFLLVRDDSLVWLIYVLTVLQFSISAFFEPARNALLPNLVVKDELLVANTLSSATWSAMLAFGAAIGGAVTGVFGTDTAIALDSLTFLISAAFVMQISMDTRPVREEAEIGGGWIEMIDGFRYVLDRPRIGVVTLVKGISQVGTADIMIALYAAQVFVIGEDGAVTLGALYASFGVGAIVGPVIGNALGDESDRFLQNFILVGFLVMPVGWILYGAAPLLPIAMIGILFRAIGGSINWVYSSVLIQMKVPDKFMGRVFALDFSIFTLMMAIAVWSTGYIIDTFDIDPRTMAFYLAVAHLAPALLWWYFIGNKKFAPAAAPDLVTSGQD
jgi:MFS family permease